ncbi:MAG: LysM peptidoglycan-binding domain-containing protein [Flavobacteriales bacterium]|jgi:membrane-bound lytic murein transglycosylase D|nr:MAG: LysM peptidoglycan-binding domain-containing protein [Flavobacteriales bacterium]
MPRIAHICLGPVVAMVSVVAQAQVTWRTDSLMGTWAVEQRLAELGPTLGRGVVRAVDTEHLYEDLKKEVSTMPVFADSNVVLYADLYGEPLREQFRVLLGLSRVYYPMFAEELAVQGLPTDLVHLPMALSALNSQAASANGRGGLWMLTYPVALRYGLTVNALVDERHDDVLSTKAAVRYLKDLRDRYQDWGLAIMAFACGPANVTRAQLRTGGATDLRTLYPHFTDGEQEVLPLLMAFIHLYARSGELGLEPITIAPREAADTLVSGRAIDLAAVAHVMQLPVARLQALNPVYCSGHVPEGATFLLPRTTTACYVSMRDSMAVAEAALERARSQALAATEEQLVSVVVEKSIRYTVRRGDNLGSIAAKHRVSVKQLKAWNNLRSDRINAGRTLVIKVKKRELVKPSEPEPQLPDGEGSNTPLPLAPMNDHPGGANGPPVTRFVSYTVRHGDSLYGIARRFPGLTALHLMELNDIGTVIKPGQELRIPRP